MAAAAIRKLCAAFAVFCAAPSLAMAVPPKSALWQDFSIEVKNLGRSSAATGPAGIYFLSRGETHLIRIPFNVKAVGQGNWRIELWDTTADKLLETLSPAPSPGDKKSFIVWSSELQASSLRIEFHGDLRGVELSVRRYLYGVNSARVENIIGVSELAHISARDKGSDIYNLARAVVRLKVANDEGYVPCTGFLVSPSLLLTNNHCIGSDTTGIFADFFYEKDGPLPMEYEVEPTPIARDPYGFDYAFLRLKKSIPDDVAKPLTLKAEAIDKETTFMVIQHPNNEQKQYVNVNCGFLPGGSVEIFNHTCDTLGGSSGSPMLANDGTRNVIALHQTGTGEGAENGNTGISIERILHKLKRKNRAVFDEIERGEL